MIEKPSLYHAILSIFAIFYQFIYLGEHHLL